MNNFGADCILQLKSSLSEQCPNLDGLHPDELQHLIKGYCEISNGLNRLSVYAQLKKDAMEYRTAGDITLAMQQERIAQQVYKTLPDWAKW